MAKYLYEVCIERGRSNPEYYIFLENIMKLNAKAPDFGGLNNVCIISHHMNQNTIYQLCTSGLKKSLNDVSITEITKSTLTSNNSIHKIYTDMIKKLFLPYDNYPNIK